MLQRPLVKKTKQKKSIALLLYMFIYGSKPCWQLSCWRETSNWSEAVCGSSRCGPLMVSLVFDVRPAPLSSSSALRRSTHPAHQRDSPTAAAALSEHRNRRKRLFKLFLLGRYINRSQPVSYSSCRSFLWWVDVLIWTLKTQWVCDTLWEVQRA